MEKLHSHVFPHVKNRTTGIRTKTGTCLGEAPFQPAAKTLVPEAHVVSILSGAVESMATTPK